MLIRKKANIISLTVLFLCIASSVVIFGALREIEKEIEDTKVTDEIFRKVIDIGFLTEDYMISHDPGVAKNWKKASEELSFIVESNKEIFGSQKEKIFLGEFPDYVVEMRTYFNDLEGIAIKELDGSMTHLDSMESERVILEKINRLLFEIHNGVYELSDEDLREIERHQSLISLMLISSNLALVAILIILFFIQRKTFISVFEIAKGAELIGKGEFDRKIEINSNDEIGYLASSLNSMADSLNNFYKELEKKVKERTAELEELKNNLEKEVESRTVEVRKLKDNLEKEVEKQTEELKNKVDELEKINKIMVGREIEMIKLKEKIKSLESGKLEQ